MTHHSRFAISILAFLILAPLGPTLRAQAGLDLTAPSAYAGWAGGGDYSTPVVPFQGGGTIETWIRPSVASTGGARMIATSENDYRFFFTDSGELALILELGPSNYQDVSTPAGTIELGTWQHVAFTYDLLTARLYVNGSLEAEEVMSGGPIGPGFGPNNIAIGTEISSGTQHSFARAEFDETRVWSAVRSATQIQAYMYAPTVDPAGLIAFWKWEGNDLDHVVGLTCPLHGGATFGASAPILTAWTAMGAAIPGVAGTPDVDGAGTLLAGTPVSLTLTSARPFSPSWLVIGVSQLDAPFKGGVMVPNPDLLFPLFTDFFGGSSFGGLWPAGVPSGFTTYFQWWIQDPAGPKGFAASNALAGTTP